MLGFPIFRVNKVGIKSSIVKVQDGSLYTQHLHSYAFCGSLRQASYIVAIIHNMNRNSENVPSDRCVQREFRSACAFWANFA